MAFYNEQEDDEQQQPGQAPQQTGAQSATISQGAPGGAQGKQPGTPDRPGNFVSLSNYLKANQKQAGKLGDQASGVIQSSADQARQGVNSLNQSFNQQAGQGVQADQNLLSRVGEAEKLSRDDIQKLKAQSSAQYQGPNSLSDLNDQYTQANKSLNQAKTNVQAAGTEEGRKNLITQINAKPRTAGITNFDNVLLSAGGGREKVEQAAKANQDVTGNVLEQANQEAQKKAQEIKAQTDATRQQAQGAIQGAQAQFNKQFDANDPNSKLSKAIQEALNKNNKIAKDLGDQGELDQETMDELGISEGQSLYNLDLNKFYNQIDPNAITAESVADQNDFARYQALSELAGVEPQLLKNAENIGKKQNVKSLDKEAFQEALGKQGRATHEALSGFDSQIAGLQKQIDELSPQRIGGINYIHRALELARQKEALTNQRNQYAGESGVYRQAKRSK